MKLLFVSDTYYPHLNGVYYFVRRLALLLKEKGHEISVLAPSENLRRSHKKIDGIDVYGVPSLPVLIYPGIRFPVPGFLQTHIKGILAILQPDIIHIQDHFSLAKAVVRANKDLCIPMIGTNHFMTENVTALLPFRRLNKQLESWMWSAFSRVFNKLSIVTTPTAMGARLIQDKLNVPVQAISNGIDLDWFCQYGDIGQIRKKYSIPNRPMLLYVGRLDPEKRLEEVLHAISLLIKRIDFSFVIVGKGVTRNSLEDLAVQLGIRSNIVFTGFVPDEELPAFYRLAQCFIMPSIAELQSISTMEAMASGLPVIAANAGALSELVNDGINGYLFEPGNSEEIAAHIMNVLGRNDLNREMSRKSLEHISRHNIHHTVRSFEALYTQMTVRVAS